MGRDINANHGSIIRQPATIHVLQTVTASSLVLTAINHTWHLPYCDAECRPHQGNPTKRMAATYVDCQAKNYLIREDNGLLIRPEKSRWWGPSTEDGCNM